MSDGSIAALIAALAETGDPMHDERLRELAPLAAAMLPPSYLTIWRTIGMQHRNILALREENQRLRAEIAEIRAAVAALRTEALRS